MSDNNYAVSEVIAVILMVAIVVAVAAAVYGYNIGLIGTSATESKPVYAGFYSAGQNGYIKLLLVDPGENYPTDGFSNVIIYVNDKEVTNMPATVQLGKPLVIEMDSVTGDFMIEDATSIPLANGEYNIRVVILDYLIHDNTVTVF